MSKYFDIQRDGPQGPFVSLLEALEEAVNLAYQDGYQAAIRANLFGEGSAT